MPRSRTRNKHRSRPPRPTAGRDSLVLLDLLDTFEFQEDDEDDGEAASGAFFLDILDRASWSFFAGPDAWYLEPGSTARSLARLRRREWFLFEFELATGLTAAQELILEREGEPGTAGERRALNRFLDSECGAFDVEDVQPDGTISLAPVLGGDKVLARPIDRGDEMIPGGAGRPRVFAKGDTIVGRLYWSEKGRAELSAGADRISADARAALLADPPGAAALRSGLVAEALFGADAGRLLAAAADVGFPGLADDFLEAVSGTRFDYGQLWRELEGESSPVDVARQVLSEMQPWTAVEQELAACAVVGAWLRRREADAGRKTTPETLVREHRGLDEHLRSILDVPAEPELRLRPGVRPLAMSAEDAAEIGRLAPGALEWVIDIAQDDRLMSERIQSSLQPYPVICAIVEQPVRNGEEDEAGIPVGGTARDAFDEDADEEELEGEADVFGDAEDEGDVEEDDDLDDESDEDGAGAEDDEPLLIEEAPVAAGEDEAQVALDLLVDALRGSEEGLPRPRRMVFRQRRVAARLADTLRDAGLGVAVSYFTDAVDMAMLHFPGADDREESTPEASARRRSAGAGREEAPPFSPEELEAHARLSDALSRSRDELESRLEGARPATIMVTPATAVDFPFATLEGNEETVRAFAVQPRRARHALDVYIYLVPPGARTLSEYDEVEAAAMFGYMDLIDVWTGDLEEMPDEYLADLRAGGWPCSSDRSCAVVVRDRLEAPPVFVRGRDLQIVTAVMQAVAALIDSGENRESDEESAAIDVRIEPLGDVKVGWRTGDV